MLYYALIIHDFIGYFSTCVLCHIGYYGIGYHVTMGIMALGNISHWVF